MNRKQRRALERKGEIPKAEPHYTVTPREMANAVMSGHGKEIMMAEIHKNLLEREKVLAMDLDTCAIWTLYNRYGWGKQRLKKFYNELKLKEKGIDIEAWYDELFDGEGNYRSTLGGTE